MIDIISPKTETVVDREIEEIIIGITKNKSKLKSYDPEFAVFESVKAPDSVAVTEMDFSKHKARVLTFHFKDKNDRLRSQSVVVKRLSKKELEKELKTYERINASDIKIPCFNLCFSISNGDNSYFATTAEPNIMPLSAMLRTDFRESPNAQSLVENYRTHLVKAVVALLRVHKLGILHKDWTPKNFGINTKTGDASAFDFESSNLTDNKNTPIPAQQSIDEVLAMVFMCTRYATDGYFSFDTKSNEARNSISLERKKRLQDLGVSPVEFKAIGVDLLQSLKNLYQDSRFQKQKLTSETDRLITNYLMLK